MRKILNEQLYISDSNPIKARTYDYKSYTYPLHFHCEFELMYIENGHGQCIIGDSIMDYADHTLILFGPELPHCMQSPAEYKTDKGLRVNGTIIQFERDFMQYSFTHYVQFIHICNMLNDSVRGIKFDIAAHEEVKTLLNQIPLAEGVEQIILFLKLLQLLSMMKEREYGASLHYDAVPTEFKNKKIEKIIAYISKRYTENISLQEIASFSAMNPSAFCRFFKENTGKTFKQYITDLRINYACKLLANHRFNISEISIECGFESIIHFNRCFRKITATTPSEYRKRIMDM